MISLLSNDKMIRAMENRAKKYHQLTALCVAMNTQSYQLHWFRLSVWFGFPSCNRVVFASTTKKRKQISSIWFLLPPSVCLISFLLQFIRATESTERLHIDVGTPQKIKKQIEPNRCLCLLFSWKLRGRPQQSAILIVVYATFTENVADL